MDDLELLRRFEPIAHYTQGEHFFPMAVEQYVSECSLWEVRPDQLPQKLVPEGQLTMARLMEPHAAPHSTVHYLRFVEQLTPVQVARFVAKHHRKFAHSRGRLARVGLASRLIDALFTITLIMRGRVPGGTAAAAHDAYQRLQDKDQRHIYYGRVVRQGGFICLQYWFFYCMNDWRTSFHGVNDHEGDWEQIMIYVSQDLTPQWVAFASHDFTGDDLRRRWDDPELNREGDHPIIYVGAGSHASYFSAGEYLHEVALPFTGPLTRIVRALQKFWRDTLRQGERVITPGGVRREAGVLVVPFVDYARGDGVTIGPGRECGWEPRVLPDTHDTSRGTHEAWAHHYRGLWGLFARDPVAGENAPAGPKYNRDGSVRRSWFDPLGWAGLDKVTPPDDVLPAIADRIIGVRERQATARKEIEAKTIELRALGLEAEAMLDQPHFKSTYIQYSKQIGKLSGSIEQLQRSIAEDTALVEALERYSARLWAGERLPPRSHIRSAHHPTEEETEQLGRLAEAWAALSVGILILGFIGVLLFAPHYWVSGLIGVVAVNLFLEALFRREALELIKQGSVALSVVAALVLMFEFALPMLMLGIIALGVFVIVDNVRELTG